MTGLDILDTAYLLLGYNDLHGCSASDKITRRQALCALNQVCRDLKIQTLIRLDEELNASKELLEVIPYGVAMWLALSFGDTSKNVVFCAIYNAKRAVAKKEKVFIADKMPSLEEAL